MTKGAQERPTASRPAEASQGGPSQAADPEAELARLRVLLAQHEGILAERPDDQDLLRTVASYRAAVGDSTGAVELYDRAEAAARAAGLPDAAVAAILTERGIARAEAGELQASLADLEQAAQLDPSDTRSRLSQVYLYLARIMPNPPPGFERREAVAQAERLLAEVRKLAPDDVDAARFQGLIDAVRARMDRPARTDGSAPPP